MGVGDVLSSIGQGVAGVGKAAGRAVQEFGPEIGTALRGDAGQVAYEQRQQQYSQEEKEREIRADELERQLDAGRRYGTLTPDQQQQLVQQITGVYPKAQHAPRLMQRLQRIAHGGQAQPQAPLQGENLGIPTAFPQQGTLAADTEAYQQAHPPKTGTSAKSPPIPSSMLPPDVVKPNGEPLTDAERAAGGEWVLWNGAAWPVQQKPNIQHVKGHLVRIDPATNSIVHDYGPIQGSTITSRESIMPGDDGQMHKVKLYSVRTPQGETLETTDDPRKEAEAPTAAAAPSTPASVMGKKPAAKPKTTTPSTKGIGGVLSGFSRQAMAKDPVYRAKVTEWSKLDKDAKDKNAALQKAIAAQREPSPFGDQELIYSWVRSNVVGAGRMTNAEIQNGLKTGSFGQRVENYVSLGAEGLFTDERRNDIVDGIKRAADAAKQEADTAHQEMLDYQTSGGGGSPSSAAPSAKGKWSKSKYLSKHPGIDIESKAKQATAAGYEVVD